MKVLLIEDDEAIAEQLKQVLTTQHYLVEVAADGQIGWDLAEAFEYDLILLDLMLPKLDGIWLCQRLRQASQSRPQPLNQNTPILLMTAEDTSSHRVAGLDAGADDYIQKPFDLEELLARVRALLRRGSTERSPLLRWGPLQLDPSACQASYKGQPFHLSSKEYSLLALLLRYPQRIFSHTVLIEHLWEAENIPTENAVRAQIKGLRRRLKEIGIEDWLETVYGLGYRLKQPGGIGEAQGEVTQGEATQGEAEHSLHPSVSLQPLLQPPIPLQPPLQPQSRGINPFWEQYQTQYCDRLAVIEQAIAALQTQALPEDLRQQAQREAHTLKGSLGLFGLDQASNLSQELEQLLKTDRLTQLQQKRLLELASNLRQILEQPPASASRSTAPTEPASFSVSPSIPSPNLPPQKLELPQRSRLLIVDDDAHLLAGVQAMLQPWGFQVILLSDPQQFRHTLETVKPDLLMLDIEMPGVNGIDLCEVIRNDSRWEDLPILMISASTDDETIQQVFMAGADDYVSKPIRAAELVARVIRRLEHSMVLKKLRGGRTKPLC
jgi:DNA-binding response OmpR family regulator/HPt (histidine-containing phosphotransfer) domain-containing protein